MVKEQGMGTKREISGEMVVAGPGESSKVIR